MRIIKVKMATWILCLLISCVACSMFFYIPNANAETAAEYIDQGEDQLLSSETVTDLDNAFSTFQTAYAQYPTDPVVNIYIALIRVCNLVLTDSEGGFKDFLSKYGFSLEGEYLDNLDIVPPENQGGDLELPDTAPSGETVRSFLADSFLAAIDDSILNLDTALLYWGTSGKHIITKDKLDSEADLEVDYGDIMLLRSLFKFLKMYLSVITAYDLNVSMDDIIDFSENILTTQGFLDKNQDLLKLLPTTTTATDNGTTKLAEARTALISAI